MAKKYKCRVEYLESTGTQWIDTGVTVDTSTDEIKLYFELTETENYKWFFGEYDNNARIGLGSGDGANKRNFLYQQSATKVSDTQMYNTQHLFEINSNGGFLDGAKIRDHANFASTSTIYLFNLNIDSTSNYKCKAKIWGYRHTRNGILIRDLIPVLDLSGKPAMYDQVSGKLFYNKDSGDDFTYCRQIIPVEYLESTGEQYIDTGVDASSSIIWDLDASFEDYDQSYQLNGCYVSSQRFMIGVNASNYYSLSYVGNNTTTVLNDNKRHSFQIDAPNKTWSIDGGTYSGSFSDNFTVTTARLLLFARKTSSVDGFIRGRIYCSKFINNGVLVRDFIPCIDENHVPFMFDLVNNTVYLNAGTGQFKVGPNVEKVWGGKKLRRKLALMLASLKKKRPFYAEVEYLESDGNQYINTGYTGNSTTRVIIGASSSLDSSNIPLFGARDTNGYYNSFSIWQNVGANGMRFDYTDTTANVVSSKTWLTTGINIIEKNGRYNYVNGVQVNSNAEKTFSCNNPFYLMSINTSGISVNGFIGSVSFCKIYDGGVLVRDFIPVLDWNMIPCMYDKVTEQLFYNQGTGSFVAGRQIHPVEYLESTGTQYIDTGIQPTDDYGYRIKNTYTAGGGEQCAIGCMDSGNRFVGIYTGGPANAISGAWGDYVGFLPNYPWTTGTILDVKCNYKNSRQITIDDTEMKDISDIHVTGTISNSIYIGARNYGSNVTKMRGNIYCAEITNGQNVVADFIPAIDENGVGFMFDRVTHTIFDNAGTGAFKYPPVELEYLECVVSNTNKPYIDTGVYATENTRILAKLYTTDTGNRNYFGGTANGSSLGADGFVFNSMSRTQLEYLFGKGSGWKRTNATNIVGIPFELDFSKSGIMVDGSVIDVPTYTSFPSQTLTVTLFVRNGGSAFINGRVYYFKMYENGTLVRDFIPCYKDGVACMVDKLTGTAYLNQGTGSFSAGRILEPEYE